MPIYLDEDEFNRWMNHAKSTLKSAYSDESSRFFNWACFKAQQSAEFSAKAFLRGIGTDSFGHSVSMLLKKGGFSDDLIQIAKKVDKYYIPTRYTDVWSEGLPEDYYTIDDAKEALECSETIISGVENRWKLLRDAENKEKK